MNCTLAHPLPELHRSEIVLQAGYVPTAHPQVKTAHASPIKGYNSTSLSTGKRRLLAPMQEAHKTRIEHCHCESSKRCSVFSHQPRQSAQRFARSVFARRQRQCTQRVARANQKSQKVPSFCISTRQSPRAHIRNRKNVLSFCARTTPIPAEGVIFVEWVRSHRAALRD